MANEENMQKALKMQRTGDISHGSSLMNKETFDVDEKDQFLKKIQESKQNLRNLSIEDREQVKRNKDQN